MHGILPILLSQHQTPNGLLAEAYGEGTRGFSVTYSRTGRPAVNPIHALTQDLLPENPADVPNASLRVIAEIAGEDPDRFNSLGNALKGMASESVFRDAPFSDMLHEAMDGWEFLLLPHVCAVTPAKSSRDPRDLSFLKLLPERELAGIRGLEAHLSGSGNRDPGNTVFQVIFVHQEPEGLSSHQKVQRRAGIVRNVRQILERLKKDQGRNILPPLCHRNTGLDFELFRTL